jgi:hypothetical protein
VDLTSLRRLKYALGIPNEDQDAILTRVIGASSAAICRHLRRLDQDDLDGIQRRRRVEYFSPVPGELIFFPAAYPFVAADIESLSIDAYGQYGGSEQNLASTSYVVTEGGRAIAIRILPTLPAPWHSLSVMSSGLPTTPNALRLIYVGGLAEDPVVSTWTKSADVGGTGQAGNYWRGKTSRSVAYAKAWAAGAASLEVLSGVFEEGEDVEEFAGWKFARSQGGPEEPTGVTATLTTCTSRCLAESQPALVEGCEMQARFLHKNRDTLDTITVSTDGGTRVSRADLKNKYGLVPEIEWVLGQYINKLVP